MGIQYLFPCRPVNLSTNPSELIVLVLDKVLYYMWIMEVAIFRWQVDRWTSTNTHNAQLSTCILGLTGWLIPTDNTLFSVFDLTTMAEKGGVPYTLVYLLTFLSGSIGPELNIGVQGTMGISYLFTSQPVDLSTRVDRSRGKYNPLLLLYLPQILSSTEYP